jgi:predicted membrane protein
LKLNDKLASELKIRVGAGKAMLRLGGLPLTRLNVDFGAGEMELDLKGAWTKDLDATVQGGVGEARVILPKDVGVRVKAQGGIGEIKAEGLRREGGYYVNDQYGKSPIDIRLEITGGVGTIRLIG